MKSNKAQIKFGETFGVIIIVYLMIFSGLVWYNKSNQENLKQIYNDNNNNLAYEKYQFIYNLDLLHDSKRGDIDEEFNYISLKTMQNYSNTTLGKEFLLKRLDYCQIKIKIYNFSVFDHINSTNMQETIVVYNKTYKNKENIIKPDFYRTLIPIRDNLNNQNLIGLLEIKALSLNMFVK